MCVKLISTERSFFPSVLVYFFASARTQIHLLFVKTKQIVRCVRVQISNPFSKRWKENKNNRKQKVKQKKEKNWWVNSGEKVWKNKNQFFIRSHHAVCKVCGATLFGERGLFPLLPTKQKKNNQIDSKVGCRRRCGVIFNKIGKFIVH